MGLFKKRTDPGEIERLRSEMASMAASLQATTERLDAADREKAQLGEELRSIAGRLDAADGRLRASDDERASLGERLQEIVTRLETPIAPPTPPPPPPPNADDEPEVASLDEVERRFGELATRLDGVDARITAISTELANQIDELSGEIGADRTVAPPTDEVVEELRDAQTRLANEQARYQIAFRQDLADLADRLRRH